MSGRATVVLPVDAVEPSLPFWEALGFAVVERVQRGDRLGQVVLRSAAAELILQTRPSLADDLGDLAFPAPVVVYVDVADLDAAFGDVPIPQVVVAERRTYDGSREMALRSPGGHVIVVTERA